MKWRQAANDRRDRGSVAVEFALLLPVLLLLVFGIIDFGRAINDQITLTQAAREGVRLASLGYSPAAVNTRTESAAAPTLTLTSANITVTPATSPACAPGAGNGVDAVVKLTYTFTFITPVGAFAAMFGTASFGSTLSLSATGTMPCET
jgi:Flp pilus assembly protein TadG